MKLVMRLVVTLVILTSVGNYMSGEAIASVASLQNDALVTEVKSMVDTLHNATTFVAKLPTK